jgi:hypothetical protein
MHSPSNAQVSAQPRQDHEDVSGASRAPGMLEVTAAEEATLADALENAVAVVSRAADEHRTGILIVRIGSDRYVVRAHPGVPYGLVRHSYL